MDTTERESSYSICRLCVYETHPTMLTTYSIRGCACDRCGRVTDLAMVLKG